MIIGIDGNNANVAEQVGVSVYTQMMISYFQAHATQEVQFKIFLKHPPLDVLPKETEFFTYVVIQAPALWSMVFLPSYLYLKRGIDVYFAPAHYAPSYLPCPLVVAIHDLAFLYYPGEFLKNDLYKLTKWTTDAVTRATKVIAVSKTTKKDMLKWYNTPDSKISVIYNGFEKSIAGSPTPKDEVFKQYSISEKKYVLYVGTVQPRKNIQTLLYAFKQFHAKHPEMKLILVGKKGWMYDKIFEEAKALSLEDSVQFTGFLPDETVITLYKHAFCFALPSLYEGFGIPLLEAMQYDCPVITSFTSSLPEIGGEACLYFDPQNPADLTDKFELLMNDETVRKELISKGKERVKAFSWESAAKETMNVLVSAASST